MALKTSIYKSPETHLTPIFEFISLDKFLSYTANLIFSFFTLGSDDYNQFTISSSSSPF
jgi:hypothetical protein